MRTLWVAVASVGLAGCMNFAKFDKRYEKKYCDEWDACDSSMPCPFEEESDPSIEITGETCEDESTFDRKAANDCLDSDQWTCDDSVPNFPLIIPPSICAEVCDATGEAAA